MALREFTASQSSQIVMDRIKHGLVSDAARTLVCRYVNVLANPQKTLEEVASLEIQVSNLPNRELFAAVASLLSLSGADLDQRVAAAGLCLQCASDLQLSTIDKIAVDQATKIVVWALKEGTDFQKGISCTSLASNSKVPRRATIPLRRLLTHPNEAIAFAAAMALSTCGAVDAEGMRVLTHALSDTREGVAGLAAAALARIGVRRDSTAKLIEVLANATPAFQKGMLTILAECSLSIDDAVPVLWAIIRDQEQPVVVRRNAVTVAARLADKSDLATPILLFALGSASPAIAEAGMDAVTKASCVPPEAVDILAARLTSDSAELRSIAARGLTRIGAPAQPVIDAVVASGCIEPTNRVREELATAAVSISSSAVYRVLKYINSDNLHAHCFAVATLLKGGAKNPLLMVDLLHLTPDLVTQRIIVHMIWQLREKSASVVNALAKLLDETPDDQTAAFVLGALLKFGRVAQTALPAVVRRLHGANESIARAAREVILEIGPTSIPALQKEISASDRASKSVVDALIGALETQVESRFRPYAGVDRVLLDTFVAVADIMTSGPISQRDLEKAIRRKVELGELEGPAFDNVDDRTIAARLATLSDHLGIPIVDQQPRKRGRLSSEARDRFKVIKDYLEWLDGAAPRETS